MQKWKKFDANTVFSSDFKTKRFDKNTAKNLPNRQNYGQMLKQMGVLTVIGAFSALLLSIGGILA